MQGRADVQECAVPPNFGENMKLIAAAVLLLVLIVSLALAFPPRHDLLTTVDIAAPPARVWAVLTDTASYPAWNPDMVLKGALVPGQAIEHDQGQGSDRMVFYPTIVTAEPAHELSWRGQVVMPGILDAWHYFRLEPVGTHTVFTQGEHLRGVLLYAFNVDKLLPDFAAMNAHLKARAEQSFPTDMAPTTSRP